MKQKGSFTKTVFVLLVALIVLACNFVAAAAPDPASEPAPTSAPEATKTAIPAPTSTFTPRPTYVPAPTATKVPPTPTPAAKGETVTNGKIEVTVLDLIKHDRVKADAAYSWWTPNPGYAIIDLFVKVKNLQAGTASLSWDDMSLTESGTGTQNYVFAGGWKGARSKEKVAPLSFGYAEVTPGLGAIITFDDTVYLQIFYFVSKDSPSFLFNIGDAPLIQVNK